jgi:hypothetical protein
LDQSPSSSRCKVKEYFMGGALINVDPLTEALRLPAAGNEAMLFAWDGEGREDRESFS